jgi:hypothetical protein
MSKLDRESQILKDWYGSNSRPGFGSANAAGSKSSASSREVTSQSDTNSRGQIDTVSSNVHQSGTTSIPRRRVLTLPSKHARR